MHAGCANELFMRNLCHSSTVLLNYTCIIFRGLLSSSVSLGMPSACWHDNSREESTLENWLYFSPSPGRQNRTREPHTAPLWDHWRHHWTSSLSAVAHLHLNGRWGGKDRKERGSKIRIKKEGLLFPLAYLLISQATLPFTSITSDALA